MPPTMIRLKHTDPREWGYLSAQAGPKVDYFLNVRCADLSPDARELAIEGWNEYQEARDETDRMIGGDR